MRRLFEAILCFITSIALGMSCPMKCRCENSMITNCSSTDQTDIPNDFPYNTRIIDLSFNKLMSLKGNLLGDSIVIHLSALNLSHNYISNLEKNTFAYESELTEIDLSYNMISRLNSRIFKGNPLLAKVSFQGNKHLYLTHFGGFLMSDTLQELDMSHCNLRVIPNGTFRNLPKIEKIDLSFNNITTLEPLSFNGLNNLKFLDISNNSLSRIDVTIFKTILHIHVNAGGYRRKRDSSRADILLKNNPWICDCKMREVYDWCKNVDYNLNLICTMPEEWSNMSWSKLGELSNCPLKVHKDLDEKSEYVFKYGNDSRDLTKYINYKQQPESEFQEASFASPTTLTSLLYVTLLICLALSLNVMWIFFRNIKVQPYRDSREESNELQLIV